MKNKAERSYATPPLLLLLLLLRGLASYNYWVVWRGLTQNALDKKAAAADLASAVSRAKFDHLKDLGLSLVDRPILRQLVEEENWSQTDPIFQEWLKEFPIVSRFVLVDPSGTLTMDTPSIPLVRGKNFAYRDWFKGVSKNWQPYLSKIFSRVPSPHEHQVGLAVPIRSNKTERVVGVLQLQELVDPLFAWGKEVEVGPGGFVYFVDQHGNVAGHPKFPSQGGITDFSKVPAVQKVLQGKKEAEVFFDPAEKQALLLAYKPVPDYGWGVIVQQPAAAAFAQRQRTLRLLLFFYGVIALLVCFLSARILREIAVRKRSAEQMRLIIEAAPSGMIMVDREGKIGLVNSQTETLFGYTREELVGQRIEMLVPERFRANHPGHRDSFFADPKVRSMGAGRDLFGLRKDGTEVPVEIGLSPVETPEGRVTLASIMDITERKQAEDKLTANAKELMKKTTHLERFQRMTVDREFKMVQLKEEINGLLSKLGQAKKYEIPEKLQERGER